MIDIALDIAADCPVEPAAITKLVEGLIVDAVTEDVQQKLAAYADPETGERAGFAVTGSLAEGLEFEFRASSLELVELVRDRFGAYGPLQGGALEVRVSGPTLATLRLSFSGPSELVALVERKLQKGGLVPH